MINNLPNPPYYLLLKHTHFYNDHNNWNGNIKLNSNLIPPPLGTIYNKQRKMTATQVKFKGALGFEPGISQRYSM